MLFLSLASVSSSHSEIKPSVVFFVIHTRIIVLLIKMPPTPQRVQGMEIYATKQIIMLRLKLSQYWQ